MAVHTLEHDAFAIEVHHAVFHFKPAEADALGNGFEHTAVRVAHGQQQVIEIRRLAAPKLWRFDRELHVERRFGFARCGSDEPSAVGQFKRNAARAHGWIQCHLNGQIEHGVGIAVIQKGFEMEIGDMRLGDSVEIHVAEQAGHAHEVLIFQPASRAPALHAACQFIFAFDQVICQLKLAGREGIARKTDVMPVEPYGDTAFRALKGDEDAPVGHLLRHEERLDIAGDGVVCRRNFADGHILIAVPRILHVGVLRRAVALHLNVSRNADIRPAAAVVIHRLKTGDNLSGVERVMEFPEAVQGMAQACFADAQFLKVCVSDVIGMRVNPVFGEKGGIFQPACVKFHHRGFLSS